MRAAGLSTLLGIGTELATDDEDRLIRAIRGGAQDIIDQRQLQVAPTMTKLKLGPLPDDKPVKDDDGAARAAPSRPRRLRRGSGT